MSFSATSILWATLLPALPQTEAACELTANPLVDFDLFAGLTALSGDTLAVVGSPFSILTIQNDGNWALEGSISPPNTVQSLALDGDTLLVGMPLNDDMGTNVGAVYVYERSAGTWSLSDMLYPSRPVELDAFGFSVAIDGDRACVGSPGRRAESGSVFVFERAGRGWIETAEIEQPDAAVHARFGLPVALSGQTVIASDRTETFAFVEAGAEWAEQARFGSQSSSMSISGDTVILVGGGLPLDAPVIFSRVGTVWSENVTLPGTAVELWVANVVVDGDLAVVYLMDPFAPEPGRLYARSGSTWSLLADLPVEGFSLHGPAWAMDDGRIVATLPGVSAWYYDVPSFLAPSVEMRNAGTNPESYNASPVYVGQDLSLTVDLTTTGHDMALVIGFDSPFGLTLGGGQTLLCFDLLGSGGELINTGFHPGPIAEIELAVPNDLAFAGFTVCTQAVHAFGVVPFALSNAQDIVIGAACF